MRSIFVTFILVSSCLFAQTAPTTQASSANQRPEVRQLLELMHTRQQMEVAINGMKDQFKRGQVLGLQESLRKKGIVLSPQKMEKVKVSLDAMADDIFKEMPYDEMVSSTAEIYARHFSPDDVKAMIAFYQTAAGQKYLAQLPGIMQESMQACGDIMKTRIPEITRQAEERMQQLIKEPSAQEADSPSTAPSGEKK